jgi:hypothetical protein
MSQAYPGQDGAAIVYSPTGSGGISGGVLTIVQDGSHGVLSIPKVVTGNDDITSGNASMPDEANRDGVVWLAWRTPDWINGGDYSSVHTGTVTTGITLVIANAGQIVVGGPGGTALLSIGDNTHPANLILSDTGNLIQDSGSTATWNGASNWNSGSVTHFKSGSTFQFDSGMSGLVCSSPFSITAALIHIGVAGVNLLRDIALTSVSVTAGGTGGHAVADSAWAGDISQADMIEYDVSGLSAARTWTLSHPASGGALRVVFYPVPGTGVNASFKATLADAVSTFTYTINTAIPFALMYSTLASSWVLAA